uniref:DoxX family protein n=1 Tax=Rhodosorus marinus TaxID=101924 RepID=A0A7S3EJ59_9RHOD|mmetsp:Transcript_40384/g.160363  ORF Transcript_40384/g.160363 Transcript_40384/m.160363 type:complete len:143 (+) Transcript_40384:206-634(+)
MVKAKLIVSIVIRLMLSAVFLMAGTVKLTDKLDENTHEMMLKGFDTYAEMFKIDTLGLNPDQFRVFVGTLEVISVVLLWFVPLAGSFLQVVVMIGAAFIHIMASEFNELALVSVLLILASVVFILHIPVEEAPAEPAEKKTQ